MSESVGPEPEERRLHRSFEEHAESQGVRPVLRLESLIGGWPADELDNGFEEALARWRKLG